MSSPQLPPDRPPIPAIPISEEYEFRQYKRPSQLPSLGVASIVIGLLSLAASGFTAVTWWGWYVGSVPPRQPPAMQVGPPLPPATLVPYRPGGTGPDGLPTAIDRSISKLRSDYPSVTDRQVDFIAGELEKSKPRWTQNLNPETDILKKVSIQPGNVLDVIVYYEGYYILPDGRAMRKLAALAGLDAKAGAPIIPTSPFRPIMPGDPRLMAGLAAYCALVVALAVFLIGAGVITLSRPAKGLRLHLWFAGLKIACILTEVWLSMAYFDSVRRQVQVLDSIRHFDTRAGMQGLTTTVVIQSIYPLIILVVFFTERAREAADRASS